MNNQEIANQIKKKVEELNELIKQASTVDLRHLPVALLLAFTPQTAKSGVKSIVASETFFNLYHQYAFNTEF